MNVGGVEHGEDNKWLLQLADLDIGWGHKLLGFSDYTCLFFGLLYGIVIVVATGYMFYTVLHGGISLPITARWFVAFMNLEIVLYLLVVLCKMPKLCSIQNGFLPRLEMDCDLLRFLYLQRVALYTLLASVCCWVFSSLAYFLAFGFQVIDHPGYADQLEDHSNAMLSQGPQTSNSVAPSAGFTPHSLRSQARPGTQGSLAANRGGGPVGNAFRVGPSASFAGGPGSRPPSSMSMAPRGGASQSQRTSYNIPRASSSMVTSTTSHSHAALIKPPVAIF